MNNNLIFKNPYFLAMFGIITCTISPPMKLSRLYTDNRLFRLIYFLIICNGIFEINLLYSFIMTFIMLAIYDLMIDKENDSYKPFYGKFLLI
tara:strand:- start:257 stop:532 length:276 start_codon:yes stop_codon:yes gene_type:complete